LVNQHGKKKKRVVIGFMLLIILRNMRKRDDKCTKRG